MKIRWNFICDDGERKKNDIFIQPKSSREDGFIIVLYLKWNKLLLILTLDWKLTGSLNLNRIFFEVSKCHILETLALPQSPLCAECLRCFACFYRMRDNLEENDIHRIRRKNQTHESDTRIKQKNQTEEPAFDLPKPITLLMVFVCKKFRRLSFFSSVECI